MRTLFLLVLLVTANLTSSGQILISILLGDKLNSDKLEFGIDGGMNFSNLQGLEPSSTKTGFNLGFYFDIRMKNRSWMLHTGVQVKSTMGADEVPVYSLGDTNLDNAFEGGSVKRKLGYFNLPIMMKYQWPSNFCVEAGPMFGLMSRSTDEFTTTVIKKDDLHYKLNIRDRYHPLDAGLMAGVGHRLLGGNGMNIGVRYYYGLVDITVDDSGSNQHNRSFMIFAEIPIGVGKKAAPE
jgi:hypothetical protein